MKVRILPGVPYNEAVAREAEEEELSIPELIGWILFKFNQDEGGLARLFNVHPTTIEKWLEGRPIDLVCAQTLLGLLQQQGDDLFPLLVERLETPSTESWPDRITKVKALFGPTTEELVRFLGTDRNAFMRWERGMKAPGSCYAVMIDLLYRHPETMGALLENFMPEEAEPEPWSQTRVYNLAAMLRVSTPEFANLLHLPAVTVRDWISGRNIPGPCASVLLSLLETFPDRMVRRLSAMPLVQLSEWPSERYVEARMNAGLSREDFEELTGISQRTFENWERRGVVKTDCPAVLYGLLEASPTGTVQMLRELRAID